MRSFEKLINIITAEVNTIFKQAFLTILLVGMLGITGVGCNGNGTTTEMIGTRESDGSTVALFDTAEIVLRAGTTFNGNSGSPNPFVDVKLTATFNSPSGRSYSVDGFFDGNGNGGPTGDVFKIRIFADELGAWTWSTWSSIASLKDKSGNFICSGTLEGVFAQGPVVANPKRPRTFMYREGNPVYLIGKFLDIVAPRPIQFSHTLFSELLSVSSRQAMLDRHADMNLNKMNVYIANKGDYGGVSTTPWVGFSSLNDKKRFDLSRWRIYDTWTRKLRDAGLVAHLWFFADDSGFGELSDADRQLLIKYTMARLSAYVNTMFILALEWQEGWSEAEVENHANFIHKHNPWDRLVSVHGQSGDFSFPSATWADYMDIQRGNDHRNVHATALFNRSLADKPLIMEEFSSGKEDTLNRQKTWAAFTAGVAGSGTGAFLRQLASFVTIVPFERMEPADELVVSGNAYGLAEPGRAYVFYLYDGGSVSIDLSAVSGILNVHWFNPRLGGFSDAGNINGGRVRLFYAPDNNDWVLYIHMK